MRLLETGPKERPEVRAIFQGARHAKRTGLLETESRELLRAYGISLPPAEFVSSPEEAATASVRLGFPLAMKVVSSDIVHKSDAGGVKLNLKDEKEVAQAFDAIIEKASTVTSRKRVLGTMLSPMAPAGQECIVGMIRDAQFGPVIMFGLGGIFVEVLKDVSFRVAPMTEQDLDDMIRETKGYKLLTGIRGEKPKDIGAVKKILAKLNAIAADSPEIQEIDLNPVIVHEQGASIVDSRVILTP